MLERVGERVCRRSVGEPPPCVGEGTQTHSRCGQRHQQPIKLGLGAGERPWLRGLLQPTAAIHSLTHEDEPAQINPDFGPTKQSLVTGVLGMLHVVFLGTLHVV